MLTQTLSIDISQFLLAYPQLMCFGGMPAMTAGLRSSAFVLRGTLSEPSRGEGDVRHS
jgi:hypothetical protein